MVLTENEVSILKKEPKKLLRQGWYCEKRIFLKLKEIKRYRGIAESITAAMKDVAVFGSGPSQKIESCAVEIVALEEDIKKELAQIRRSHDLIAFVASQLEDENYQLIIDARYLQGMHWVEISELIGRSLRWTLRLHGEALKAISDSFS